MNKTQELLALVYVFEDDKRIDELMIKRVEVEEIEAPVPQIFTLVPICMN